MNLTSETTVEPLDRTGPDGTVELPPASKATHLLRGAAALIEREVARALERHGLTAAQFAVLQIMGDADRESLGCGELGKRLAGPASDVTRLLDRLETGGLVSRNRDAQDRRVVHTKISEKGREVLAAAAPCVRAAEERALATLGGSDRIQLTHLLEQVLENLPGN